MRSQKGAVQTHFSPPLSSNFVRDQTCLQQLLAFPDSLLRQEISWKGELGPRSVCGVEGGEQGARDDPGGGGLCAQLDTRSLQLASQHAFAEDLGFICRRGSAFFDVLTMGETGALGGRVEGMLSLCACDLYCQGSGKLAGSPPRLYLFSFACFSAASRG